MKQKRLNVLITWPMKESFYLRLKNEFPQVEFTLSLKSDDINKQIINSDIVFAGRFSRENFVNAKNIKWIQLHGHGADGYLFPELKKSNVILTNAGQVHSIPIAEHVFAMMLNHSRKITELKKAQEVKDWRKKELYHEFSELYGSNLLLIGLGNIGEEIAKRGQAFGMNVIGIRKQLHKKNKYVHKVFTFEELECALKNADYVIVSLPSTPETIGLIGQNELNTMKANTFLINVGRGNVIKEMDLIEFLSRNKDFEVGLDVFEQEPLPTNSKLYSMDNVLISPHVSGISGAIVKRQYEIFKSNLTKYLNGEQLENLVDKQSGY